MYSGLLCGVILHGGHYIMVLLYFLLQLKCYYVDDAFLLEGWVVSNINFVFKYVGYRRISASHSLGWKCEKSPFAEIDDINLAPYDSIDDLSNQYLCLRDAFRHHARYWNTYVLNSFRILFQLKFHGLLVLDT